METNASLMNLSMADCPIYSEDDVAFLSTFRFWIEGVLQTVVAILGILGNIFSSYVITRKEMRNSFNLLLVSLAVFDSTYLLMAIFESFRKPFNYAADWHIRIFAHFLYPVYQISMSGSVFMTVAISWERYFAIHYPLDYSKAMNDADAIKNRWVKYVVPVILLSLIFNVTRFFEASVQYSKSNVTLPLSNKTIVKIQPYIGVTPLRKNALYASYNNWSCLIILGLLPFVLLFYFNIKMFKDIRERRKRRFQRMNLPHAQSEPNQQSSKQVNSTSFGAKIQKFLYSDAPANKIISTVSEGRRRAEDNLAVIFVGFTFIFFICHTPRIILSIYEIASLDRSSRCNKANQRAFSPWSYAVINISHFLLVLNSAMNMLVYCLLSSKFRDECSKLFLRLFKKRP